MEGAARIIGKSTPRFAKVISWKYAELSGEQVVSDLWNNHGLKVSKKLVQSVSERVGAIILNKASSWNYRLPNLSSEVSSIGISRDGTTIPIRGEGYKIAMAGTISLYDDEGKRLHTIYVGCSPQKGKATFDATLEREILAIKLKYPKVIYGGIADGEKANWTYLEKYTDYQILDFYHAISYVSEYSKASFDDPDESQIWLDLSCEQLKNQIGAAQLLQLEMKDYAQQHNIVDKANPVTKAVTYFANHMHKMEYHLYDLKKLPIGSGVVEAACKTLVKQRFSKSGCKWYRTAVDAILRARSLILTPGRWNQFWNKLSRYGF